MWGYIESGKQEGAKIILGGVKRNSKGYYVDPTSKSPYLKFSSRVLFLIASVFTDIRPNMKIVNTSFWFNSINSGLIFLSSLRSKKRCAPSPQTPGRTYADTIQIFGPVLSVGVFKTEEEAINLANDTTYGLGAGLHSSAFFYTSTDSSPF